MAAGDALTMAQARKVLAKLREAFALWAETDAIRRSLPAKLAVRVPASRVRVLASIVSKLKSRGAIRDSGVEGYGWVQLVAAVAIVGVIGAAVIVAFWPTIQREHRAAMDARNKARQLQSIAQAESREAGTIGPERARQRAQQRVAESVQLYQAGASLAPSPAAAFGPGAGGGPGAGVVYKALAPYALPLLIIGGIVLAVKLRR